MAMENPVTARFKRALLDPKNLGLLTVSGGSAAGRGVYVDHVSDGGRLLPEEDFTADGWFPSHT